MGITQETQAQKMRVKILKREQDQFKANHCTGNKLKTNCLLCGNYYQPSPTIKSKNNLFCYMMINLCWITQCHPELEEWMKSGKPAQPEFNSIACAVETLEFDTIDEFDARKNHLNCIYEKTDMSLIDQKDMQDVIEHGQDIPIKSYEHNVTFEIDMESCRQKTTLPYCVSSYGSPAPPELNSEAWIESGNVGLNIVIVVGFTVLILLCLIGVLYLGRKVCERTSPDDETNEEDTKVIEEEQLALNG